MFESLLGSGRCDPRRNSGGLQARNGFWNSRAFWASSAALRGDGSRRTQRPAPGRVSRRFQSRRCDPWPPLHVSHGCVSRAAAASGARLFRGPRDQLPRPGRRGRWGTRRSAGRRSGRAAVGGTATAASEWAVKALERAWSSRRARSRSSSWRSAGALLGFYDTHPPSRGCGVTSPPSRIAIDS